MPDIDAKQVRDLLGRAHTTDRLARRVRKLLEDELKRLRATVDLRPRTSSTRAAQLADLAAVFLTGNKDLEALALLHARFIGTVNLNIDEIAVAVHCHERTLRRCQRRGYALLAQMLSAGAEAPATDGAGPGNTPLTNLPRNPDRFVGREADMAAVERLLSANRVVALRGPAGVGKTRLAVEVGHRLRDRFPGGVWYIALEHLAVPELLPLTVATVVRAASCGGATDDPAELLRDLEALLILDRCEHVGPAVGALVADLTARAPYVRVLRTTRRVLGPAQEASWPLAPLDVPDAAEQGPDALAAYASVALFVDRLRALQPSFALDNANAMDVALLVRRLDGMPLAIEVAAGCAAQLPLGVVASRLTPTIARRTTFSAPAIDTPSSVRAAVEMGLSGLPPAEHLLLTHLAVFAGGFDLDAARAVCMDTPDDRTLVPQLLANLVRGSLVISEHVGAGPRFRLLEVMRAYAEDMQLRGGAAERVRQRHAEYFAALAIASHDALHGDDVDAWMTRLALEHANLQAALLWLRDADPALALRAVARLDEYWQISGQLSTGRQALADALRAYEDAGLDPHSEDRLTALTTAGVMARNQSDFPVARSYLEAALAMAREREDPRLLTMALRRLGNVAEELGERVQAAAMYRESAAISEAIGDVRGVVMAHNNLGILADHEGRHEDALEHHREAQALLKTMNDPWLTSVSRANLALALVQLHRFDEALVAYQSSLRTARELGDRVGIHSILSAMSYIERTCGRVEQAWDCLREALPLVDDTGDRQKATEWLESAAKLLVQCGQHALAAEALGASDAHRARWSIEVLPKDLPDLQELEADLTERLGADRVRAIRAAARARRWQEVAAEVLSSGSIEARGA